MSRRSIIASLLSLTIATLSFGKEPEQSGVQTLTVTYAEGRGRCLIGGEWVSVSGSRLHWQMLPVHQWHEFNVFSPQEKHGRPPAQIDGDYHVRLVFPQPSKGEAQFLVNVYPELTYLERMKVHLRDESLVAGRVVVSVSESDLYRLNRLLEGNPFEFLGYKSYDVPTAYTVCKMELKVAMDGAKATFKKDFWGKVKILSDRTVPIKGRTSTFARQLLLGSE